MLKNNLVLFNQLLNGAIDLSTFSAFWAKNVSTLVYPSESLTLKNIIKKTQLLDKFCFLLHLYNLEIE
jgi:hypothetical protein